MEERPKITLVTTKADKLVEILGWLAMATIWALAISFGSKWNLLILPIIATILFLGMTILSKIPHVLNYPVVITKENVQKQYANAVRMLRWFKLVIAFVYGLIVIAIQKPEVLGIWLVPLIVVLIFPSLLYFIIKSFKNDANDK